MICKVVLCQELMEKICDGSILKSPKMIGVH